MAPSTDCSDFVLSIWRSCGHVLFESETISEVANAYADDEQDGYVVGSWRCRDWAPRAVQCVHRGRPNRVQDLSNIHTFLSNVARRGAKNLGNGGQYLSPSTFNYNTRMGNWGRRGLREGTLIEFYPPAEESQGHKGSLSTREKIQNGALANEREYRNCL